MTFGAYPRVSRQGAREDERLRSPEFQIAACRGWATRERVGLREYPAEVDVSGSKVERRILDRIIADIERGELAGIVVARLDRLARLRPRDRIELFDRIEAAGGVVRSASENLDESTPEGRFARDVFLGVARMQWERYAEGFEVAKAAAIRDGVAIKTLAPFGYRFDERHRLVVERREARIVVELFELRRGGASYAEVGALFERRTGRRTSRPVMRHLVANRAYLGELIYGSGEGAFVNSSAHPAIVELELFEAVQAVNLARSREHARGGARGRPKSLLAGIARCAGCGKGLTQGRRGRGVALSYKCPSDARHCSERAYILSADLEAFVVDRVLEEVGPAADELVELEVELDARGDRVVAEHRLAEAERLLVEWAADVDRQERSPGAYDAGLKAREARVERRRLELEALGEASDLEQARATLRSALTGDELEVDERRRLLAVVLEAVVVRKTPRRGAPAAERAVVRFASSTVGAVAENGAELLEEAEA